MFGFGCVHPSAENILTPNPHVLSDRLPRPPTAVTPVGFNSLGPLTPRSVNRRAFRASLHINSANPPHSRGRWRWQVFLHRLHSTLPLHNQLILVKVISSTSNIIDAPMTTNCYASTTAVISFRQTPSNGSIHPLGQIRD